MEERKKRARNNVIMHGLEGQALSQSSTGDGYAGLWETETAVSVQRAPANHVPEIKIGQPKFNKVIAKKI
jgi:hypothetical protein